MKEIKKWRVLDSCYLFREPWLTVRKEKVQLPNGHIIPSYYILDYPSWVGVIALTKDGKMVIVRQFRPGIGKVLPELCAGVVDDTDANPMEAAQRELMEETGYGNGKWELFLTTSANPTTHSNLAYCYLAQGVEKLRDPSPEDTEDLSVELFEPAEVLKMLIKDEILQSIHATALWKFFYLNIKEGKENI